ncbi:MAG TPA: methylmalonyl-CoA mutase family protein [Nannocystis sp.]
MTDDHDRGAPATLPAWRELAARELGGAKGPLPEPALTQRLTARTPEGLTLPVLATADDVKVRVPREPLLSRARRGWAPVQEYRQVRAQAAGAAAAEDLSRGTEGVWFVVDEAIAAGVELPHGRAGVALGGPGDLAALLAGVDLGAVEVTIDAGARALPVAAMLAGEAERRAIPLAALRGAVAGDPLALLSGVGRLGWPIEHVYADMAELTAWARQHAPGLRTALVDASVWHEAGATAADEVAVALAVALEYLRAFAQRGIEADAAAEALQFVLAVGRDLPLGLAKLRAARVLWARVAAACGVGPKGQVMRLHARASRRELSRLDPWVNLIRATTEGITAALGGADSIALPALDEAIGEPSELGRRLARNTQLILRDEARLGEVLDPVGGSYAIEQATDALARAAWERLRVIEREGGLWASLRAGKIQARIAEAAAAQAREVATLRLPIVGASRYAAPVERSTGALPGAREEAVREAMSYGTGSWGHGTKTMSEIGAALAAGAGLCGFGRPGPAEQVQAVTRGRLAEPFEALRARGAALGAKVALVAIGTASEARPRVEFARAYFPVGGFAVVEGAATEDLDAAARQVADSGAAVAVICGADARYPGAVPALVPKLRAAGARVVVLAGRPKDQVEALKAAGVDEFIATGADALATLGAVQQRLEVQP